MAAATTKKKVEIQTAQKGIDGKTTRKTQIVVSGPYMEILIGGSYTKKTGEHARYGHVALRVVVDKTDTTYDFGRYGQVWGAFDSEGEGILRVWSAFQPYIKGENALGRQTVGFVYSLKRANAQKVHVYFKGLCAMGTKRGTNITSQTVYQLKNDYHATSFNCTILTIDGALQSGKAIVHNPEAHSQRRGMNNLEGLAAKFNTWPWHKIFMPADLHSMLNANTVCPYVKKNTYGATR